MTEGEPAEFRTAEGSWVSTADAIRALLDLAPGPVSPDDVSRAFWALVREPGPVPQPESNPGWRTGAR